MGVRRTDGNLMFLYALYLSALSIGNLMDRGMVALSGFMLPASVLFYPITLLVLCIVNELWTEDEAYKLALLGLSTKFLGIIFVTLASIITRQPILAVTAANTSDSILNLFAESLRASGGRWIIGTTLRMWSGSIVSFAIAQLSSVWAFGKVYEYHVAKCGSPWGGRWVRYLVSCIVGETLELGLFTLLVFAPNWSDIQGNIPGHITARIVLTIIGIIPYYALTWRTKRRR